MKFDCGQLELKLVLELELDLQLEMEMVACTCGKWQPCYSRKIHSNTINSSDMFAAAVAASMYFAVIWPKQMQLNGESQIEVHVCKYRCGYVPHMDSSAFRAMLLFILLV